MLALGLSKLAKFSVCSASFVPILMLVLPSRLPHDETSQVVQILVAKQDQTKISHRLSFLADIFVQIILFPWLAGSFWLLLCGQVCMS